MMELCINNQLSPLSVAGNLPGVTVVIKHLMLHWYSVYLCDTLLTCVYGGVAVQSEEIHHQQAV